MLPNSNSSLIDHDFRMRPRGVWIPPFAINRPAPFPPAKRQVRSSSDPGPTPTPKRSPEQSSIQGRILFLTRFRPVPSPRSSPSFYARQMQRQFTFVTASAAPQFSRSPLQILAALHEKLLQVSPPIIRIRPWAGLPTAVAKVQRHFRENSTPEVNSMAMIFRRSQHKFGQRDVPGIEIHRPRLTRAAHSRRIPPPTGWLAA